MPSFIKFGIDYLCFSGLTVPNKCSILIQREQKKKAFGVSWKRVVEEGELAEWDTNISMVTLCRQQAWESSSSSHSAGTQEQLLAGPGCLLARMYCEHGFK